MQRLAGSGSGGQGLVRMTLFSTRPCIEKNCTIRIIGQYSTIVHYYLFSYLPTQWARKFKRVQAKKTREIK